MVVTANGDSFSNPPQLFCSPSPHQFHIFESNLARLQLLSCLILSQAHIFACLGLCFTFILSFVFLKSMSVNFLVRGLIMPSLSFNSTLYSFCIASFFLDIVSSTYLYPFGDVFHVYSVVCILDVNNFLVWSDYALFQLQMHYIPSISPLSVSILIKVKLCFIMRNLNFKCTLHFFF